MDLIRIFIAFDLITQNEMSDFWKSHTELTKEIHSLNWNFPIYFSCYKCPMNAHANALEGTRVTKN